MNSLRSRWPERLFRLRRILTEFVGSRCHSIVSGCLGVSFNCQREVYNLYVENIGLSTRSEISLFLRRLLTVALDRVCEKVFSLEFSFVSFHSVHSMARCRFIVPCVAAAVLYSGEGIILFI